MSSRCSIYSFEYLESDPNREGLLDTPKRVIDSWDEVFAGYKTNAEDLLQATFNAEGYDGIVLLSNIEFIQPVSIIYNHSAVKHVAYIPAIALAFRN